MSAEEFFVGAVAIGLGCFAVFGAITNSDWYFQLRKAAYIERKAGRGAARLIYGALGTALIALGVAITLGFSPNASGQYQALEADDVESGAPVPAQLSYDQ
jgi:hypothetical protein